MKYSKKIGLYSAVLALCAISAGAGAGWLPSFSEQELSTIRNASMARANTEPSVTLRRQGDTNTDSGIVQNSSVKSGPSLQNGYVHPLATQVLFIEAKEQKKKTSNLNLQAEVFLFDYTRVETSVELVNANTGELVSRRVLDTVQLPLNDAEADYATQLLSANADLLSALNNEYQHHFGVPLPLVAALSGNEGASEGAIVDTGIDMKVSIWVPDDRLAAGNSCSSSRCALVSVFTANHFNFSIEPVIDLVSGEIFLDAMQ